MSSYQELISPQKPKDIPLRPLKGMRRDLSPNVLPVGQLYDVRNMMARTTGLQRRNGLLTYLGGTSVTHPPITLLDTIWDTDGVQFAVVLDSKMIYYITNSLNMAKWTYSTNTVTCTVTGGVTRATGSSTAWTTNDIKKGDVFYCANLTGTRKWGIIKSVNSATEIDLETNEGTATAGSAYEIRRAIWAPATHFPDAVNLEGEWLICDRQREARSYNPGSSLTSYGYWSSDSTFDLYPASVCFFKDRLFFGRTIENNGTEDWRQRIRWTTTLDYKVLPALQFLDLPYTPGYIRRLVGMENSLLCYMSDAIWAGRLTNLYDQLPVAFDIKLETGGIGLVGDRAVLPYLGGHFFVGDDNIYYIGQNLGVPEAIGDPIKDMFFSDPDALWSVQICPDPVNTRLLFTEPSIGGGFSKIFSFDYRSKEWTYEENIGTFVGRKQITRSLTYDAWITSPPYDYDTGLGVFPSYDAMGTSEMARVYIGYESGLRYFGTAPVTQDPSPSGAVAVTVESGDFDYGELDTERIHLRLSLKLKSPIAQEVAFDVFTSTDEGLTWKQVRGRRLVIDAGQVENYVNFRARGSTFRWKIVSSSICDPYTIKEIVMRASGAGVESHLASNR